MVLSPTFSTSLNHFFIRSGRGILSSLIGAINSISSTKILRQTTDFQEVITC